ncbi:hypothetical protein R6Q59_036796 [Mikania micrantha]
MAAMTSMFNRTPNQSTRLPKTRLINVSNISPQSISFKQNPNRKPIRISCGLIETGGGKLDELVVPESQRDVKKKEAMGLAQIKLSRIDLERVHA